MKLRKGYYVIRRKWLRIYCNGSFSKLEINLGKIGGWELICHLGALKNPVFIRLIPSIKYLEQVVARVKRGDK